MSFWWRVFGKADSRPESASTLIDSITAVAPQATTNVTVDNDERWVRLAVTVSRGETPVYLERFHRSDEGIRGELQAWAAWLETCDYSPNHQALMTHMIQTQQVFTLRKPVDQANEILVDKICLAICRYLAAECDGVYQIDGQGFFSADGTLLLQEY
jgi:hypothetical protein